VDLRPLTLAELLDRSFSTYKRHLWLFVGIMAVPAVWSMVFAVVMELLKARMPQASSPGSPPEEALMQSVLVIGVAAAFGVVYFLVYLLAYALALGATTVAVSHLYMGRGTTVGAAYAAVRRHGGRLVLLLLWGWVRIFLTLMAFVAAGGVLSAIFVMLSPILSGLVMFAAIAAGIALSFFLIVRWGVAVPAVVLENLGARGGLRRSVELTEDNRGRVFLVILCAAVIGYATVLVLQVPFVVAATLVGPDTPLATLLNIVGAVLGGIGAMFSGPIMIIGLAMIYYDLRIRKEALDLQLMQETLDAPGS
jgi:hypothetical protein